ncbi:MAG: carboxylating nicotinate-nucleotide diphosphorylase [Candidatus Latescibacterota bacterium]
MTEPQARLEPAGAWAELVEAALREDLGTDRIGPEADVTTSTTVPAGAGARARLIARQAGTLAGVAVALAVFRRLDPQIAARVQVDDGGSVGPGEEILLLRGRAQALLAGERTALNFLQHLGGVATLTRAFVEAVAGTGARITDTRKTTPGLRALEKEAVRLGGGVNHRMGLYDAVLIKENHAACAGGVGVAVARARAAAAAGTPIYAEARDLAEVAQLLPVRPDRILLDNMTPAELGRAVEAIRASAPRIQIEATGGITLANVRRVALTGVDLISVGALTHSAPALDLSLLFAP